jgi:hypothetical protein
MIYKLSLDIPGVTTDAAPDLLHVAMSMIGIAMGLLLLRSQTVAIDSHPPPGAQPPPD